MSDERVSEERTIIGLGSATERDNGWWSFSVQEENRQYPTKLDTKLPELVERARKACREKIVAAWRFDESDGNPNPNRPGTFYKNRMLKQVDRATDEHRQTQTSSSSSSGGGGGNDPVKDDLIVRQFALREAVNRAGQIDTTRGAPVDPNDEVNVLAIMEEYAEAIWKKTSRGAKPDVPKEEKAADDVTAGVADTLPEGYDDSIPFLWLDMYGVEPLHRERS